MSRPPQRAIIHVDMDAFFASVEQRDHPAYAGRPVIVGGVGARGVVAAASYEARAYGVHSAMPMARARMLCPEGVCLSPRMQRYRDVSERIFRIFEHFTPVVEGLSLDEAFLDVSGSLRLLGTMERMGRQIRAAIEQRTGLVASVGMAHNKFLAKLASGAQKPAGFVLVEPDAVRGFLDPMPVNRLWGIGPRTGPRLRRLGVLTIGQLRRADPEVLREVLGNRTAHFVRLASGEDDRPVEPQRAEQSISRETTFSRDLSEPGELRSELQRLSEAVTRRLRRKRLAARTIHLKIRDHRFRSVTRSKTLRSATSETETVYRVATGLLHAWLAANASTPVRLLGVGLSGLKPGPGSGAALDVALDRIADRFGDGAVTHAQALKHKHKHK